MYLRCQHWSEGSHRCRRTDCGDDECQPLAGETGIQLPRPPSPHQKNIQRGQDPTEHLIRYELWLWPPAGDRRPSLACSGTYSLKNTSRQQVLLRPSHLSPMDLTPPHGGRPDPRRSEFDPMQKEHSLGARRLLKPRPWPSFLPVR